MPCPSKFGFKRKWAVSLASWWGGGCVLYDLMTHLLSCGVFVSNFYEYFSHLACQLAVSTVDAERAYSKLRAVRRIWHAL